MKYDLLPKIFSTKSLFYIKSFARDKKAFYKFKCIGVKTFFFKNHIFLMENLVGKSNKSLQRLMHWDALRVELAQNPNHLT